MQNVLSAIELTSR